MNGCHLFHTIYRGHKFSNLVLPSLLGDCMYMTMVFSRVFLSYELVTALCDVLAKCMHVLSQSFGLSDVLREGQTQCTCVPN